MASSPGSNKLLPATGALAIAAFLLALQPWAQQQCPIATASASAERHDALPPPPPRCELALASSPWAAHCRRLRRVCLDYSTLIHFNPAYQPQTDGKARMLPKLDHVSHKRVYKYPWMRRQSGNASSNATLIAGGGSSSSSSQQQPRRMAYEVKEVHATRHLKPPHQRPATSLEPTPYLRNPAFSTCTVPVLLGVTWDTNLWHVMSNAAVWFAMARRTPWLRHLKPLIMTPEGWALTELEAQLLPPLSPLSLQTLADASNRLPPGSWPGEAGTAERGQAGAAPAVSYEGGEQRCFQDLFVCGSNIKVDHWSWRDALEEEGEEEEEEEQQAGAIGGKTRQPEAGDSGGNGNSSSGSVSGGRGNSGMVFAKELFGWGQAVVAHVEQQRLAQQAAAFAKRQRVQMPEALVAGLEPRPTSTAVGGTSGTVDGGADMAPAGTRQLSIIFLKRDSQGRQLLNAEELVQLCNGWQYEPAGSGTAFTARCRQAHTQNITGGVDVAQEADVLVGMHGANMANSWFMRPGSSTVEIMPFEYELHPGANTLAVYNAQDPTSQLLWWVAVVCDPAISQPGPAEQAGEQPSTFWSRERSARLPWAALEQVFRHIAEVNSGEGNGAGSDGTLGTSLEIVGSADSRGSRSSLVRQRYLRDYYAKDLHRFNVDAGGIIGNGQRCPALAAPTPGGT